MQAGRASVEVENGCGVLDTMDGWDGTFRLQIEEICNEDLTQLRCDVRR